MNYQDKTLPELLAEIKRLDNEIFMASFSDAHGVYGRTHDECARGKEAISREIQARGFLSPILLPEKQPAGLREIPA